MNSRYKKWETWLDTIGKEIKRLYVYQNIFDEVREIIGKNKKYKSQAHFMSTLERLMLLSSSWVSGDKLKSTIKAYH